MATNNSEKEVLELERQYWQALKDKDVDAAIRMTADPCLVTGAQGVANIDRQSLAAMMRQASYTLDDFELQDGAQVRLLGNDVAIVAYKVREELTVQGEPVMLEAAESSTWVWRDGRWLCAAHSESLIGDPFGRDRENTH